MTESYGILRSTRQTQEPPTTDIDRIPDYDPNLRNHFWIVIAVYRVDPKKWFSGTDNYLDLENLVGLQGIGCYYCEKMYTEKEYHSKCKGEPDVD